MKKFKTTWRCGCPYVSSELIYTKERMYLSLFNILHLLLEHNKQLRGGYALRHVEQHRV